MDPDSQPTAGGRLSASGASDGDARDGSAFLLRTFPGTASLRSQLLTGLAILLVVALLAVAAVVILWIPVGNSAGQLLVGLLALIGIDVLVLVLFGDYLLQRLVVEPVDGMVAGAERIAAGEDSHRLEAAGSDELQRLSRSVNQMADRLINNQRLLAENVRSLDETNRRLTAAQSELINAEKMASVGRLAAGIAHEIGNPLGAILGYLDVAERRGVGGEWAGSIREESRRIDRIVRGLLDYARPKAAAVKPVAVNDIVRRASELLEVQGRLKGLRFEANLASDVPAVLADRFQLEQVLVNLLLNATDSIEEADVDGEIRVTTRQARFESPASEAPRRRKDDPEGVDYSHLRRLAEPHEPFRGAGLEAGGLTAVIEIADNGRGLRPEDTPRIFDPFFTTKEPGRGTGLGLAVSARLVDGMGGVIEASAGAEGGAVFSITLPALPPDELRDNQEGAR